MGGDYLMDPRRPESLALTAISDISDMRILFPMELLLYLNKVWQGWPGSLRQSLDVSLSP